MWGNLSDLAKIAQEQALKFNLDNMAGENDDDGEKDKEQDLDKSSQQSIFSPLKSSKNEPSQTQQSLFSPLTSQITQPNDAPKNPVPPSHGNKLIAPTPNKTDSETAIVEQQPQIENETKDHDIAPEERQSITLPVENDGSVSSIIQENNVTSEGDLNVSKENETDSGNINLDQVSLNLKKNADTTLKEDVTVNEKSETTASENNNAVDENIKSEERSQIDEWNKAPDDLDSDASQMNIVNDANNDCHLKNDDLRKEGMEIDELAVPLNKVTQKEIKADLDPPDAEIVSDTAESVGKSKSETQESSQKFDEVVLHEKSEDASNLEEIIKEPPIAVVQKSETNYNDIDLTNDDKVTSSNPNEIKENEQMKKQKYESVDDEIVETAIKHVLEVESSSHANKNNEKETAKDIAKSHEDQNLPAQSDEDLLETSIEENMTVKTDQGNDSSMVESSDNIQTVEQKSTEQLEKEKETDVFDHDEPAILIEEAPQNDFKPSTSSTDTDLLQTNDEQEDSTPLKSAVIVNESKPEPASNAMFGWFNSISLPTSQQNETVSEKKTEETPTTDNISEERAESTNQKDDDKKVDKKVVTENEIADTTEIPEKEAPMQAVPQFAIEKFMDQLSRLHTEHENDLQEAERRHQSKITEMENEIELLKKQRGSGGGMAAQKAAVASYDKYLAAQRKMERDFNEKLEIAQKDLDASELTKASLEQKIITLQKDLHSTSEKLNEKEKIITKMQDEEEQKIAGSKNKAEQLQKEVDEKSKEITSLKQSLEDSKGENESLNEAFNTLKTRVKAVATELKDRRAETRTLSTTVEELTKAKSTLEEENASMKKKLVQEEKSGKTKDQEIDTLTTLQEQLQATIVKLEKGLQEKNSVGDKALATYKKKAQALLASANARAAGAEQARDEAESDAATARSEAYKSNIVAKEAQEKCDKEVQSCQEKLQYWKMNFEKQSIELSKLREELENSCSERDDALEDARKLNLARESILDELNGIGEDLHEEQEKNRLLSQELSIEQITCRDLRDEVETLRDELQRNANAEFMARQKTTNEGNGEKDHMNSGHSDRKTGFGDGIGATLAAVGETDGTVLLLQQELQGANDAIKELKDALKSALLGNPNMNKTNNFTMIESQSTDDLYSQVSNSEDQDSSPTEGNEYNSNPQSENFFSHASHKNTTRPSRENDSTPLYFALEKQTELNTARDEIARLANLLGQAESDKMEAVDSMLEMKRMMEEADARLRRYEKLGIAASNGGIGASVRNRQGFSSYHLSNNTSNMTFNQNFSASKDAALSNDDDLDAKALSSPADSTVNLEYLKNVMFSFMNAKSLNEKKGLVPVVAAVIDLTADEQQRTIESLEESAGLQGVGTSLIESLQSKSGFW